MSRKAPIITLDELKEKLEPMFDEDKGFPYDMPKKLDKDLGKVQHDWENWEKGGSEWPELGYKLLKNKLPVLWMMAGGDWECPVYFIIYWDGKSIRGYIPEDGNTYDHEYKAAYGSQEDTDKYNDKYGHLPWGDPNIPELSNGEDEEPDFAAMEDDIINRITIIA